MSFAGHVFDMIARMKANARRKRDPFDKEVKVAGQSVRAEFLREACPVDIDRVRKDMAAQRAQERRRLIILLVVMALVVFILWLVLSQS